MKFLFVCEGDAETHDSWSGISRSLVTHLREAGHEVHPVDADLYGFSRFHEAVRAFSFDSGRWRMRYRLGGSAFRARSRRANRHVRQMGTDVDLILQVGATFRIDPVQAPPIVLYCDSNIAVSETAGHTGVSEASALGSREIASIRIRERSVYEDACMIFTMSDHLRRSFREDFDIPAERLLTVHCGPNVRLDQERGPGAPESNLGPPTILFVGRDFERKGGALLLDAFRHVRRTITNAQLLMVGDPPESPFPDGVYSLGYLDRDTDQGRLAMDHAYRCADVFCLPTRFEPFGTAFLEAMYYGLPCVGPDAWAVPEIIVEGKTGRLCRPDDPKDLARILSDLLRDPERARSMGAAGRRRVVRHFTWERIVDRMTAAVEELPGGPDSSVRSSREGESRQT